MTSRSLLKVSLQGLLGPLGRISSARHQQLVSKPESCFTLKIEATYLFHRISLN
jgi:hypothetical protein